MAVFQWIECDIDKSRDVGSSPTDSSFVYKLQSF